MPEDAAPEPIEAHSTTGPFHVTDERRGRVISWLRIVFATLLGALFVANVAMYSLYQALRSRVESQDHRIERLNSMITDVLSANENAAKVESISQKVDGIETQVKDLSKDIKETLAQEAASKAETEAPKKGKGKKKN